MARSMPRFSAGFYDDCRAKVVDVFGRLDGVQSIYEFGTVRAEGHSDIDLFFVLDPDRAPAANVVARMLRREFTDEERYLVDQHPQLVLPPDLARFAHWLRPLHEPRRLWGEEVDLVALSDPYMKLYLLAEVLVDCYPRLLENNGRHPRRMMQFVNAVRYVDRLYQEVRGPLKMPPLPTEADMERVRRRNDELRRDDPRGTGVRVAKHLADARALVDRHTAAMKARIGEKILTLGDPTGSSNPGGYRRGMFVFTDRAAPNSIRRILGFRGKTIAFYANPLPVGWLFSGSGGLSPELAGAVRARNEVLEAIGRFNAIHNGGTNIYQPWWQEGAASLSDRLRVLGLDVAALFLAEGIWR